MYRSTPADPAVALDHADALIAAGRLDQAEELLVNLGKTRLSDVARARFALTTTARISALEIFDDAQIDKTVTEAIELARKAKAPVIEGRALAHRGLARESAGKPDEGTADVEAAIGILTAHDDGVGLAFAYRARAVIAYDAESNLAKALANADTSIAHATRVKDDELLALAHNSRGTCLLEMGRADDAYAAYKDSEAASMRALREDLANTRSRPNMALLLQDLGRIDEALAAYTKLRSARGPDRFGNEEINLIEVYQMHGDLREAARHGDIADGILNATGNSNLRDFYELELATNAYVAGDDEAHALHLARAQVAAASTSGSGPNSPLMGRVEARAWLDQGKVENIPKLQKLLEGSAIVGGPRVVIVATTARLMLRHGMRDEARKLQLEYRSDKLFTPYLDARLQDALLDAELAQTPDERKLAMAALTEVRDRATHQGFVTAAWEATVALAELAHQNGMRAEAASLAKTVATAATAAGYKRQAAAANALLRRLTGSRNRTGK